MKILLIDDEDSGRVLLTHFLSKHKDVQIVGQACNGFEGFQLIQELTPDLVFLDVQMPKLTGLEMLELVKNPPVVVFATAFDQFAVQAFEKQAVDYLLKPFSQERLDQALDRARDRLQSKVPQAIPEMEERLERIAVKVRQSIVVIPMTDVLTLESDGDYVKITTATGKYFKEMTLKELERKLSSSEFLRVHRSAIVRLDQIKSIEQNGTESWLLTMAGQLKVKVSSEGRKALRKVLGA